MKPFNLQWYLCAFISLFFLNFSIGQDDIRPVAQMIQNAEVKLNQKQFFKAGNKVETDVSRNQTILDVVGEPTLFSPTSNLFDRNFTSQNEVLKIQLPYSGNEDIKLNLIRADHFTHSFQVIRASEPNGIFPYEKGAHYWGIVEGDMNSLAAISIVNDEIMGFVSAGGETYTIGKLDETPGNTHIIYKTENLKIPRTVGCDTDDNDHYIGNGSMSTSRSSSNCVQLYVEVDYDIFVGKGGVTEAADYVSGAFSQVAILYANDGIDFTLSEILVWDVADPYTGPSTSNYLTQFRNYLNGNYNGDLAHLVGYTGSGGIAYVDVLCNSFYGVGYSDINSSYAIVPNYSWTVEVLTHEIGHNLGSSHTHACVWNGNNTAIDGCGPAAGYSEGCNGPIPSSGTIMSYCHLVGGVGIDFNLGFGPQPAALIQSEVANASCLTTCSSSTQDDAGISSINAPTGSICANDAIPVVELFNYGSNALTNVTIEYQLDGGTVNSFNWTGNLASNSSISVNLPSLSFGVGNHSFDASTSNPNGVADTNSSNDAATSNFTRPADQTWYLDNDQDGFGDPNSTAQDCAQPSGYVGNNMDCNDIDPLEYVGATCNDGDDCSINDVLDANCSCSGTQTSDSDGDGVCDALDICPGGDDNVDSDGDGTPDFCDCNEATENFQSNPLTHQGAGSSETSVSFIVDSKDPVFTISGLDAKLNGNPNGRYIEELTVSYLDANNNNIIEGVYSGDQVNSANVSITGVVNSVTLSLRDGYDGNAGNRVLSVDLSIIDYCLGCVDSDGDGICNNDDSCPGFDDNLIGTPCNDGDPCTINDVYGCNSCSGTQTNDSDGDGVCDAEDNCPNTQNANQTDSDNDGVGDLCDNCPNDDNEDQADADNDGIGDVCDGVSCPNDITVSFDVNPLTHVGSGSSSSTTGNLPSGTEDASFSITDIGSKTNGNPGRRYIDVVTVEYVDGTGSTVVEGVYSGDDVSSVDIVISGTVQSISVSLSDGYDGDSGNTQLSVNLSVVTACQTGALPDQPISDFGIIDFDIFPNPAQNEAYLKFGSNAANGTIVLTSSMGQQLHSLSLSEERVVRLDLNELRLKNQLIFISFIKDDVKITKRLIILD